MTAASSNSSEQQLSVLSGQLSAISDNLHAECAAATEQPLIELRNIGVWYQLHSKRKLSLKQALLTGRFHDKPRVLWALRNVSAKFYKGQTVGIVGHNGAGKSTLCLVLSRILAADEGEATIRGKTTPLFGLGKGFNADQTGRANIFLYAAFLGIPRKQLLCKLDEIIAFSELGDFIDEPIFTYSSGMRGRLGFSVAAILEPEILILDEVLGPGDRQFRAKSRARIREMMEQSRLIVIVSHMLSFLRKTCTHCLWLDHGQVRMFGETELVLDAYEDATGGRSWDADDDDDDQD